MQYNHDHSDHISNPNKKFVIGICLNFLFIIIESFYGIKANSMALIADAVHNLGDVFGLFLAWFGFVIMHKKAPQKFTYGFKNATIITAFLNSLLLFVAITGISLEAFHRIGNNQIIASNTIILVAFIGVLINGLTAYFFFHDRHFDINIRGAFLHMALDAIISLVVIISGFLMLWKSWMWIDSAVSLIIIAVIAISSYKLFRESLDLMLYHFPLKIDFLAFIFLV